MQTRCLDAGSASVQGGECEVQQLVMLQNELEDVHDVLVLSAFLVIAAPPPAPTALLPRLPGSHRQQGRQHLRSCSPPRGGSPTAAASLGSLQ